MAAATWQKVNGVWTKIKNVELNVSSAWKQRIVPWVKVAGVWKKCMQYFTTLLNTTALWTKTCASSQMTRFLNPWEYTDNHNYYITKWYDSTNNKIYIRRLTKANPPVQVDAASDSTGVSNGATFIFSDLGYFLMQTASYYLNKYILGGTQLLSSNVNLGVSYNYIFVFNKKLGALYLVGMTTNPNGAVKLIKVDHTPNNPTAIWTVTLVSTAYSIGTFVVNDDETFFIMINQPSGTYTIKKYDANGNELKSVSAPVASMWKNLIIANGFLYFSVGTKVYKYTLDTLQQVAVIDVLTLITANGSSANTGYTQIALIDDKGCSYIGWNYPQSGFMKLDPDFNAVYFYTTQVLRTDASTTLVSIGEDEMLFNEIGELTNAYVQS